MGALGVPVRASNQRGMHGVSPSRGLNACFLFLVRVTTSTERVLPASRAVWEAPLIGPEGAAAGACRLWKGPGGIWKGRCRGEMHKPATPAPASAVAAVTGEA